MAKKVDIPIEGIKYDTIEIAICGDTPLVTHAWDEKAKRQILDEQRGKKKTKAKDPKIPINDFKNSLYWLTPMPDDGATDEDAADNLTAALNAGAKFGFPCSGIKQSIISGAYRAGLGVAQTELRGTFFIEGATEASTVDLAEIVGPYPEMREDMVRIARGGTDIRHRGEFKEWRIPIRFKYLTNGKYSLEQLLNLINFGGFVTGIGEWRPEKDGQFGMYHLETL